MKHHGANASGEVGQVGGVDSILSAACLLLLTS